MTRSRARPRPRAAFSLVEIAMAIGIAAVALLGIVSLIPFGLQQLSEGKKKTAVARILQSISGDYQLKPWSVIVAQDSAGAPTYYHFDLSGAPVEQTDSEVHWSARVEVEEAPLVPGDDPVPSPYARNLVVRLTQVPDPPAAFWTDPLSPIDIRRLVVANTDRK